MPTKYIKIKGKVKYAQIYEPDEYLGAKRWKLNLYPLDGGEWEKFEKSGIQLKVREDEDGKFITFRRPTFKLYGEDMVVFNPPYVRGEVEVIYVNQEGKEIRSYEKGDGTKVTREGEPIPVGNDSLVTVDLCVYTFNAPDGKGVGHRLEGLTVHDLVEYVPVDKPDEEEEEPVAPKKAAGKKVNDKEVPW